MSYKPKETNNLSSFFCSRCDTLLNEGAFKKEKGRPICSQCLSKINSETTTNTNSTKEYSEEFYQTESVQEISVCLKEIEETVKLTRTKKNNKEVVEKECENCIEEEEKEERNGERKKRKAELFCINDQAHFCLDCFQQTHQSKISLKHKTMSINEWIKSNEYQESLIQEKWFCCDHHIDPIFCDDDQELKCNGIEHSGHKLRVVKQRASDVKERIKMGNFDNYLSERNLEMFEIENNLKEFIECLEEQKRLSLEMIKEIQKKEFELRESIELWSEIERSLDEKEWCKKKFVEVVEKQMKKVEEKWKENEKYLKEKSKQFVNKLKEKNKILEERLSMTKKEREHLQQSQQHQEPKPQYFDPKLQQQSQHPQKQKPEIVYILESKKDHLKFIEMSTEQQKQRMNSLLNKYYNIFSIIWRNINFNKCDLYTYSPDQLDCEEIELITLEFMLNHQMNKKIHSLDISYRYIGPISTEIISFGIKSLSNLKSLNLAFNNIGDQGAEAISNILKYIPLLIALYLWNNHIGDEGAQSISSALKYVPSLNTLNLRNNHIGDEGAQSISSALKYVPSLNTLSLDHNNIGDDGAQSISSDLKYAPSLNHLYLNHNNIGDDGAKSISSDLIYVPSLISLSLGNNHIGDEEAQSISSALKYVPSLNNLSLDSNQIGYQGINSLIIYYRTKPSLTLSIENNKYKLFQDLLNEVKAFHVGQERRKK